MSPGIYLREQIIKPGDHILSLCCGIGIELKKIGEGNPITAVDIVPEYALEFKKRFPWAEVIVADAQLWARDAKSKSYDVVSIIDGIEHMSRAKGSRLIVEAKRLARKKVVIFTPEGYTVNEPENTWGIAGGDKYQRHLSGWYPEDFLRRGFEIAWQKPAFSAHEQQYNESMYVWNR